MKRQTNYSSALAWALLGAGLLMTFSTSRPLGAQSGLRTGMTWTVVGQQNGYVHVGRDAQTNAYSGDTTIDQYLPILCVLVDGRTAPSGITFDSYNGWARGAVRATAAVRGALLTSQQQGNAICAEAFGTGWRLAEFHDGRYGAGFSASSGWSYWAAGQLTPGTRFWVAISDQPANPWNSAGQVPPPVATPEDDTVLKTRLQEVMQPLLTFLQDSRFRNVVTAGVLRRFDGDDNVLLADVLRDAEQAQVVDASSPAWQSLKAQVAQFQNINGHVYYPQIYIPNFADGAVPDTDVTMVVFESDLSRTQLPAYQLDRSGVLRPTSQPVDETYAEAHEVWVLSVNERVDLDPATLATIRSLDATGATSRKSRAGTLVAPATASTLLIPQPAVSASRTTKPTVQALSKSLACNPTGLRNNNGREYLQQFRVQNPSSVENWTAGKLEPQVIIVGKGGAEIGNKIFGKIKRKTIKNWYSPGLFLTTWDRATWGDYWAYKWVELDAGPKIEISLGLGAYIKQLLNIPVTLDVKATFDKKFDDMGSGVVGFNDSTYTQYGTGIVDWTVCSVGGDGGTGNDNLAIAAIVAASSTYPYSGYAASRVNDGSRDTALGGAASWVNADSSAPNGFLPQWVQLDFGTNKTFSRVVVYTSAGYPIQDFKIQIYNGFSWVDVASVVGNTALTVTVPFAPQTARLVRILGTKGPNIQPQYVRVNEFEVYP